MTEAEAVVRRTILDTHEETLTQVVEAGRMVAADWGRDTVRESGAVVDPLETLLDERGLSTQLLDVLSTAVGATDSTLSGTPVAAPPYLVVTSRGPLCRGTLADGRRLLVELVLFGVERRPPSYRFLDPSPPECLAVTLVPTRDARSASGR